MRSKTIIASLLLGLLLAGGLSGCKMIKRMLPAEEVTDPDSGTPEEVVFKAVQAAQAGDLESGWKAFRPLLHSKELASIQNEKEWKSLRFPAMQRKIHLFTHEPGKPYFHIDYDSETDDGITKIFVVNMKSDMPTPCNVKPDPKANMAWRIVMGCLN